MLRWANASDRKFRDFLKLLGWAADKDTHQVLRITKRGLVTLGEAQVRAGRLDKVIPFSTVRNRLEELETLGFVKVTRAKQGFADKRRGMQAVNAYWVDFSKTVSGGSVVDGYDFAAPLEDNYAPQTGSQETVVGSQVGSQVGSVTNSSSPASGKSSPEGTERRKLVPRAAAARGRVAADTAGLSWMAPGFKAPRRGGRASVAP